MTARDGVPPRSGPLGGTMLGRYRLLHLLGEGGMGAVYAATHQELGKRAAVKTLHERYADSQEVRQRFLREGQAAARVRHPNIADVYDVGIEGDRPYLVMELLEGEDLAHFLAREAPISVARTADLLVPVVAALAAAHDLGVVHRDLKPENIFLCSSRHTLRPKVLDFGISKLADADQPSDLTESGALLGTPHYMSPEQAQGKRQVDARADQYALGVIAYHCVTGRRPFQGMPLYVLIQRTVEGKVPPPSEFAPELPRAFEALILQAMARQPERRHASTRAFGRALLEFASERTRSDHADELAETPAPAPTGASPSSPLSPGPRAPVVFASTLGESVHERPVSGSTPRGSRWLAVVALLALGLALGALVLTRWTRPRAPGLASANSALTTGAALAPPPLAASPPLELATPSGAGGSASAPLAAPEAAVTAPAASAPRAVASAPRRSRPKPSQTIQPAVAVPAKTETQSTAPPATPTPRKATLPTEDPDHGFIPLDGK